MKTNYLVTAQCEVLVEYANAVMAKYEKYLRSKSDLGALYSNIKEYEWIIEHIPSAVSVGALV